MKTASQHVNENASDSVSSHLFQMSSSASEMRIFPSIIAFLADSLFTPCPGFGYCLVFSLYDINSKCNIHECGHILMCTAFC